MILRFCYKVGFIGQYDTYLSVCYELGMPRIDANFVLSSLKSKNADRTLIF